MGGKGRDKRRDRWCDYIVISKNKWLCMTKALILTFNVYNIKSTIKIFREFVLDRNTSI